MTRMGHRPGPEWIYDGQLPEPGLAGTWAAEAAAMLPAEAAADAAAEVAETAVCRGSRGSSSLNFASCASSCQGPRRKAV